MDLIAEFTPLSPTYTVTAAADPVWGGSVTGCGSYREGDLVCLQVASRGGYSFVGWYDEDFLAVVSSKATYSFYMPAMHRTFTAVFELVWPRGVTIASTDVTPKSVTLALSEPIPWAEEYRVDDGLLFVSQYFSAGEWNSMRLDGLRSNTLYTFSVMARDKYGVWNIDGPTRRIRTSR